MILAQVFLSPERCYLLGLAKKLNFDSSSSQNVLPQFSFHLFILLDEESLLIPEANL